MAVVDIVAGAVVTVIAGVVAVAVVVAFVRVCF